jgi:hypothetical protein
VICKKFAVALVTVTLFVTAVIYSKKWSGKTLYLLGKPHLNNVKMKWQTRLRHSAE